MRDALLLEDVVVTAGATRILDGVTLAVPPGRIVAVVGPNGAGKTTLLDVVSGVALGVRGRVEIGGGGDGVAAIGRVFQGSPLPETLTVAEIAALATGHRRPASELLRRFGLLPHASSFVAELSTGMRRILDLAVATVGSPPVLLLDEPASGLAQAEIEYLAEILVHVRDETGATVLLVEHDAWLVKTVADEVLVMDQGRVVAHGSPSKVLGARPASVPRLRHPDDPRVGAALKRVDAEAAPAVPLPRRTVSKWTLMRLGLREFSAGLASVLILGVLSRVLKVELGVSLGVVTAVLASYNLAAPIAVAVGHRSDTRPILGRRRTPYIVAGAVITGIAVAAAPHVAGRLAGGVGALAVVESVALFVAMGLGMYGAGTVFFALLTDLSGPADRGHAASVVYLELMAGVLFGVALTGGVLKDDATGLGTLFGIAGILVVALTIVAVWGQEKKAAAPPEAAPAHARASLGEAVRGVAVIPQARVFFAFMVLSTLFLFLQQAVLTPFGGDVLHLSVRATSGFSAILTIGTIAGMVVAGRPFAEQLGHRRVAFAGLAASVVAFAGLSAAAAASAAPPAWLSILFLGFAAGLFNVSSLALMMGMADRRRTALFMGAWTLAHALADGTATAGGGLVFEAARRIFDSIPGGYATVFALEAAGLALCLPLLRVIDPSRFAAEAVRVEPELAVAAAVDPGAAEALLAEAQPAAAARRPTVRRPPARGAGARKARSGRAAPSSGSSRRRSAGAPRRTRNGEGS